MDTLTFNSPVVLRHLTFSDARKMDIDSISLPAVLAGLNLTMDKVRGTIIHSFSNELMGEILPMQFIEMCMLCGCDYLEPIKGIGAKTALKLIREFDTFEEILEHLTLKGKNVPPEDWPFAEARELFKNPNVTPASECEVRQQHSRVDMAELIKFC